MFEFIKNFMTDQTGDHQINSDNDPELKLRAAACALFLEVANSDDEFTEDERVTIFDAMKSTFGLSSEEIEELIELSQEMINDSVSLYEFTEVINKYFNDDQKYEIVKNLWRLIYADNILDPHEEYFMRKISGNLKIRHRDLMAAKAEARSEKNN